MLVVPNLTWPILFGQNHLRQTDAIIRSRELTVYFANKDMDFEVKCDDSNPTLAFLNLDFSRPGSIANITCLLTAKAYAYRLAQQGLLRTRFLLYSHFFR